MSKPLGRNLQAIDRAAETLGLARVAELLSMSASEYDDLRAEFGEVEGAVPDRWHDASTGVAWIRAVRVYVESNAHNFEEPDQLIPWLTTFEEELARVEPSGGRWYLALDL